MGLKRGPFRTRRTGLPRYFDKASSASLETAYPLIYTRRLDKLDAGELQETDFGTPDSDISNKLGRS